MPIWNKDSQERQGSEGGRAGSRTTRPTAMTPARRRSRAARPRTSGAGQEPRNLSFHVRSETPNLVPRKLRLAHLPPQRRRDCCELVATGSCAGAVFGSWLGTLLATPRNGPGDDSSSAACLLGPGRIIGSRHHPYRNLPARVFSHPASPLRLRLAPALGSASSAGPAGPPPPNTVGSIVAAQLATACAVAGHAHCPPAWSKSPTCHKKLAAAQTDVPVPNVPCPRQQPP